MKPPLRTKVVTAPVGKDPFKPLYVAPKPAASAPAKSATTTTPSTSTTTTTTTVPAGTSSGTSAPPATASYAPVWIGLVSVNGTKSATFVVGYSNGKKLTTVAFRNVKAPTGSTPTVFAKLFSLLSIQSGEATIQFGDGTPLDIAPGAANRVVVN